MIKYSALWNLLNDGMLPDNAQGLPSYMLVTHAIVLPLLCQQCSVVVAGFAFDRNTWLAWFVWQAGSWGQCSLPQSSRGWGSAQFPTRLHRATCSSIPAMAQRVAPAPSAWRSPPLSKDRQCSLSSFHRWVVLMHSTVLQVYLHWVVKVRGFFWMPSSFPRLPARAAMCSLAVPSRALAAAHEGPRLWVPVSPGTGDPLALAVESVPTAAEPRLTSDISRAGQVAGAGLVLGAWNDCVCLHSFSY